VNVSRTQTIRSRDCHGKLFLNCVPEAACQPGRFCRDQRVSQMPGIHPLRTFEPIHYR
jgi:hypothetical protein